MTDETPIAWLALEPGTPILSVEDEKIGTVDEVIADRQKDIFSGVTFRTGGRTSTLFVPADRIESLSADAVRTSIGIAESETLEAYDSGT